MAEIVTSGSHGGSDWSSWLKYAGAGLSAGAFFIGVLSSLWGIKGEMEQQGKMLQTLTTAVQKISERAIAPDAVDAKIKMALLELMAANPGKIVSPYSPHQPKPAPVRVVPVKPVTPQRGG